MKIKLLPAIWVRAYIFIMLWFAFSLLVSQFTDYLLLGKEIQVLLYGFFAIAFIMGWVVVVWLWSYYLLRFPVLIQVMGHLAGLTLSFLLVTSLLTGIGRWRGDNEVKVRWQDYLKESLSRDFFDINNAYAASVFVFYLIRFAQNLKTKELERAQLETANKAMQLSLLKAQINPHFLFNTLNSINTLMHTDVESARKVNAQLASIFRYALDSDRTKLVTLQEELDFIDTYLAIQKVRFEDHLQIVKSIEQHCLSLKIPPMVLHPLVENAVKHGIGEKEEGGTIRIGVKEKDEQIYFEVADNGLGSLAKKAVDGTSNGVGLTNTNRRLQGLYGERAGLQILSTTTGFNVSFTLPKKEMI